MGKFADTDIYGYLKLHGYLASDFIPDTADTYDLGSTDYEFQDIYLGDGAVINLGIDQDVTLTHVADTGLLLNSTRQLQFYDSGMYIRASGDAQLVITSDGYINLDASTFLYVSGTIIMSDNAKSISTNNIDDYYYTFNARDNGVNLIEVGRVQGAAEPYMEISKAGDLIPSEDSTYDLGTNTVRWAYLYVDTIVATSAPAPGAHASEHEVAGSDLVSHDSLTDFASNEHYLQTAITNISTALSTGLVKVTTGTGALSVITDSSADWDSAYSASHAQSHVLSGADHTASGLTIGYVIRASGTTTFAWAELQYSDLGGTPSEMTPSAHVLATTGPHSGTLPLADLAVGTQGGIIRRGATDWEEYALGTTTYVLKAGVTDVAWGQVDYSELVGTQPAPVSHTLQSHTGDLAYSQIDAIVDITGGGTASLLNVATHVHTAADGSSKITYTDLSSIPSTFTPAAHDIITGHTDSGLTTGHVLQATGTTTFAWQQIDHSDLNDDESTQHFLQTAITNVSTALSTGLLKVTTGTGALSSITDSSSDWGAAYTHIGESGASHTYINQSVTTGATPSFTGLTSTTLISITGIASVADEDAIKIGVDGEFIASIKFYDDDGEATQHYKIGFNAGTETLSFFSDTNTALTLSADGTTTLGAGLATGANAITGGGAGHDQFSDMVANEHIDHTGVTITAGTGLAYSTGGTDISASATMIVDLSELTDMTAAVVGAEDEMILLDSGADRRKLISEIALSAFNNDLGTGGTVTSVGAGAGMDFTTIIATGTVIMGTPSAVTQASTSAASGTTHSHAWTHTSSGGWDTAAAASHAQSHVLSGADHTASGLTIGYVIRASGTTTFAWAELQYSDLGGTPSEMTPSAHVLATTGPHSGTLPLADLAAGSQGSLIYRNATDWAELAKGTSTYVLKAGATTISWSTVDWSELSGTQPAPVSHTLQSHTGDLAYTQLDAIVDTTGGGTASYINAATHVHTDADGSSKVTYANLASIPSTFTPASHDIITGHTDSGLTTGYVIIATGTTTFAWGQMAYADISGTPSSLPPDAHILATTGPHTGTLPVSDIAFDASIIGTSTGFDLGSATYEFGNLYLDDTGIINFGAAQDVNLYRDDSSTLKTDDKLSVDSLEIDDVTVLATDRLFYNYINDMRYAAGNVSFWNVSPNAIYHAEDIGYTATWNDDTGVTNKEYIWYADGSDRYATLDMALTADPLQIDLTGTFPITTNVNSIRIFFQMHGSAAYDTLEFEVQRNDDAWVSVGIDTDLTTTTGLYFSETLHSVAPYPTWTAWKGIRVKLTTKSVSSGNRYIYTIGLYTPRTTFYPYLLNKHGDTMYGTISSEIVRPRTANTYSLGDATYEWTDLYLGDGAIIYFGDDQDVTLTHNPDTGLTLNLGLALSGALTGAGSGHDQFSDMVANEHIDHTGVTITAGTGLAYSSGGTNISASATMIVDLSELTDMTAAVVGAEDELILLDSGADRRKLISEINLSAFNDDLTHTPDAHVLATTGPHTGTLPLADLAVGTQGGIIRRGVTDWEEYALGTTTYVLKAGATDVAWGQVDYTELSNTPSTFAPSDHASEHEVAGGDLVSHDSLTDFVGNEHINHTSVTITAGTGLSYSIGGTDISASATIDLDHLGFEDLSDPGAVDRILFWDDTAGYLTWLTVGSGLDLTATTLTATAGASTFTGLTDTPSDYTGGVGGYFVKVNSTPDGLEFVDVTTMTPAAHVLDTTGPHSGTLPLADLAAGSEGSVIYRNATDWAELSKGTTTYVLKSGATTISWSTVDWSELSGTQPAPVAHVLATTGPHTGTLPLADLAVGTQGGIIRRGAADWEEYALGTTTYVLKAGATDVAWGQVDYSELVGTQPAPVAHVLATTGPHSGTLPLADLAAGSQGSIIYRNATDWAELAKGTTTYVLKSGATTISWSTVDWSELSGTQPAPVSHTLQSHTGDLAYSQIDAIVDITGGGTASLLNVATHVHTAADGSSKVTYTDLLSIPSSFTPEAHVLATTGPHTGTLPVGDMNINASIIPTATTYDLGSATFEWANLYLGDSSVIYFGNDQDVTLTHIADTSLTLTDGDFILDDNTTGSSVDSPKVYWRGNFYDTSDHEISATIQLLHNSGDPLLRIQVPDDGATPVLTSIVDFYDTSITSYGAVVPVSADSLNLGTTLLEWANLYVGTGKAYFYTDQGEYMYSDGTYMYFGVNAADELRLGVSGLSPNAASGLSLGGTAKEWNHIYLAGTIYFGAAQESTLYDRSTYGLLINDIDNSAADEEHNVNFFGDGSYGQAGAYYNKIKIFGGNANTRHLELYQIDDASAYIIADVATLVIGASGAGSTGIEIATSINDALYPSADSNTSLGTAGARWTLGFFASSLTVGNATTGAYKGVLLDAATDGRIELWDGVNGYPYIDFKTDYATDYDARIQKNAAHALVFGAGGSGGIQNLTWDGAALSASGFDLGATTAEWANLYIGAGRIFFYADQGESIYSDGTNMYFGIATVQTVTIAPTAIYSTASISSGTVGNPWSVVYSDLLDVMNDPTDTTADVQIIGGYAAADRGWRLINERQGGTRITYNTWNLDYDGTDFTQGNWGGSWSIKYTDNFSIYGNAQVSAGTPDVITPTLRFQINSAGGMEGRTFYGLAADTYDLGSTTREWANLYIGTGRAYFYTDQGESIESDGTELIFKVATAGTVNIGTGSIRPTTSGTYNLGHADYEWGNTYFGTGSYIYLDDDQQESMYSDGTYIRFEVGGGDRFGIAESGIFPLTGSGTQDLGSTVNEWDKLFMTGAIYFGAAQDVTFDRSAAGVVRIDNPTTGADAGSSLIIQGNYWNDPSNVDQYMAWAFIGGSSPYARLIVDDASGTEVIVADINSETTYWRFREVDVALTHTTTGSTADSPYLNFKGNYYDVTDYEVDSYIQLVVSVDPYLQISVDTSGTSGTGTAVIRLHDNKLVPAAADTKQLGDTNLEWNNIYLGTGRLYLYTDQGESIRSNGTSIIFGVTAADQIAISAAALYPTSDSTDALGGTSNRWSTLHTDSITIDDAPDADHTYGAGSPTMTITAGESLVASDLVYRKLSDNKYWKVDANATTTSTGHLVMCTQTIAADSTGIGLCYGSWRDDTYTFSTAGSSQPLFISETGGAITVTAPTTSGAVVRVIGYTLTDDEIFFVPSGTWVEVV